LFEKWPASTTQFVSGQVDGCANSDRGSGKAMGKNLVTPNPLPGRAISDHGIIGNLNTAACHTFRATGITVYLLNGGLLEYAQQMAAHESARTTKLYDRRNDQVTLDQVERIVL
jgi:integrase